MRPGDLVTTILEDLALFSSDTPEQPDKIVGRALKGDVGLVIATGNVSMLASDTVLDLLVLFGSQYGWREADYFVMVGGEA